MFEYDVAISFASEQRNEAEAIAGCLKDAGIKVFYDKYEQANLWGKDLYEHLSDVYQKKARYCLMLVSAAYAVKVWTTHERKNAQARALVQKGEYILPVRFDQTEIPGLPDTIGYLRFQDHGVKGTCKLMQEKITRLQEPANSDSAVAVISNGNEYWQQRKRLADTPVLKKIWSKPYWRVWIGPSEFKKARFRNLEHCRDFIISSALQGLFPYPRFSPDSIETDDEWISGEEDYVGNTISIAEHWVLFRSAQFTQNRTIGEAIQFADRVHVLHILDIATAAFEFAARMAKQGVLSPKGIVNFELHGVDGKRLSWPKDAFPENDQVKQDCWCQDESFSVTRELNPNEIGAQKRDLALNVALDIYSNFGWLDPPVHRLKDEQEKRFGSA